MAATVAAVLAIAFALVLFVCVLVTALLVAANAARAKIWRRVRPAREGGIIDARHVGGHSWVAYGWDGRVLGGDIGDHRRMIGVIATLKVQDGKGPELEEVFGSLAKMVREKESGCLMYQLTKSRSDPNTYKVLELYADQEALSHHGQTDYFKEHGRRMGPCMAGRPEVELLDAAG